MNSLVNLCVTSSAWGLPEHTEKPQQQGCFLTSYQISLTPVIWLATGQVVALQQPNTLSLNQMSMNATLCLTILNTASSPILTSTIQTISRAWKMSLMLLTIMPNKSVRASSSTEKTKNCVGLPHQHQFITMVLIRRRTILWQATCFAQRQVQPSTFISVEKIWGNSISQHLVVTTSWMLQQSLVCFTLQDLI